MPDYLADLQKMGKGNKALKDSTIAYRNKLLNQPVNPMQSWGQGLAGKWGTTPGMGGLGYQQGGAKLSGVQNAHNLMAKVGNRDMRNQNILAGIGLTQQGWAQNDILKQALQDESNIKGQAAIDAAAAKMQMWKDGLTAAGYITESFAKASPESQSFHDNNPGSSNFYGPTMPEGQSYSNDYLGGNFYGPTQPAGSSGWNSKGLYQPSY